MIHNHGYAQHAIVLEGNALIHSLAVLQDLHLLLLFFLDNIRTVVHFLWKNANRSKVHELIGQEFPMPSPFLMQWLHSF